MRFLASLLTVFLSLPYGAHEITPNTTSPPLSFCLGKTPHCMMPDLIVNAVNYDLAAHKWDTGATSIGTILELMDDSFIRSITLGLRAPLDLLTGETMSSRILNQTGAP
jgi:hypothetical protein